MPTKKGVRLSVRMCAASAILTTPGSTNGKPGKTDGVPRIPNIHQAVYEAASAPGKLDMTNWHSETACGTAHCRAGWVVTLAGDAGKAMEFCMGTPAAAALIYLASDPKIERIPDFYCSNEAALADMKRLAEFEATATTNTAEAQAN